MYEKLLKHLQDFSASTIQDDAKFSYDVADAIEKLSVLVRVQKEVLDKSPRWIPVAKQLPKNAGVYLGKNQHFLWVFEESEQSH